MYNINKIHMKTNLMQLSSALVLAIGVYMIITSWGGITPPMLSGIAFTLIGIKHFLYMSYSDKK